MSDNYWTLAEEDAEPLKLPPRRSVRQDDTHRLIPSRHVAGDESVLTRLSRNPDELKGLFELEGATNQRLHGEAGDLEEITVHELLFGVPYAPIVNAAFTHPHPAGSRFNGPNRGAWYAAFELDTAQAEVAYHKRAELAEIAWAEEEVFRFVEFLADLRAEVHDLRGTKEFAKCLSPVTYKDSQELAEALLKAGAVALVYPSVRKSGGTCVVYLRPALVSNVRKAQTLSLTVRPQSKDELLSWR